MSKSFKPGGYNSASPYFIVDGAQKMVDFLKQLFNAKELRRYDHSDGTIMHIEVQLDDTVIMIADSSKEYPANKHLMHVYVPDVDATFEKAVRLGATPVEPPKQREGDPDKRGTFGDFAGNEWAVGTQM